MKQGWGTGRLGSWSARAGTDLVEVGKAHKTITLATRPAKPDEVGHTTSTLRAGWRDHADRLVDVDQMIDTTLGKVSLPAVIVRPSVGEVLEAVEIRHAE